MEIFNKKYKPTCFRGDGDDVCDEADEAEVPSDGEWRGESHEDEHDDPDVWSSASPPPNCWRAEVITSKQYH